MGFEVAQVRADAPEVAPLLQHHLSLMRGQTPPESCHALDAAELLAPDVAFFCLREDTTVLGIGALKTSGAEGEIKSMHTAAQVRGRGVAKALLESLLDHARAQGLADIRLETGSGPEHAAARALYAGAGFTPCGPFGTYCADPLSFFMTRTLR